MSRYEQVCHMLRQRRIALELARKGHADNVVVRNGVRVFDEDATAAVLQDAFLEMGPLWTHDARACTAIMDGRIYGRKERCRLIHQFEEDWPLQSECDA